VIKQQQQMWWLARIQFLVLQKMEKNPAVQNRLRQRLWNMTTASRLLLAKMHKQNQLP